MSRYCAGDVVGDVVGVAGAGRPIGNKHYRLAFNSKRRCSDSIQATNCPCILGSQSVHGYYSHMLASAGGLHSFFHFVVPRFQMIEHVATLADGHLIPLLCATCKDFRQLPVYSALC